MLPLLSPLIPPDMHARQTPLRVAYHFANVGSRSVMTRTMYNTHVRSLKNRFAIRIRRPEEEAKEREEVLNYRFMYRGIGLTH